MINIAGFIKLISPPIGYIFTIVVFLLIIGVSQYHGVFDTTDTWFLDREFAVLRATSTQERNPMIAVIIIDEDSLAHSQAPLAIWHQYYGTMLQWLATLQPQVVGLDVVLPHRGYERQFPETDSALMRGLYSLKKTGTSIVLAHSIDGKQQLRPVYGPYLAMADPKYGVGSDVLIPDNDRVVRRHTEAFGYDGSIPTFAGQIVRAAGGDYKPGILNYRIKQNITYISASKLISKPEERQNLTAKLKGKIIIIGSALTDHDRIPQPFALNSDYPANRQPGVVIQAHFVANMLSKVMVQALPKGVQLGLIVTAIGMWWYSQTVTRAIFVLGLFILIHSVLSMLGLYLGWYWPIASILIAATGVCGMRLFNTFYLSKKTLLIEQTRVDAQREFVYAISHDLKTPVAVMLASADLIRCSESRSEMQRHVDYLTRSATVLKKEVNELLALSRIEEGKYSPASRPFDIFEVIVEVYSSLLPLARQKGITTSLSISANINPFRIGAQTDLSRIVQNLFSNAIKYSDKGKIRLRVYPGVHHRYVHIEIKDDGMGIPKNKVEHIFDKFERFTTNKSGSGLGMNIVWKLVKLLRGEIGINTEKGKGTTVWVEIPFDDDSAGDHQFIDLPEVIILDKNKDLFAPILEKADVQWQKRASYPPKMAVPEHAVWLLQEEDRINNTRHPVIRIRNADSPAWENGVWVFDQGAVITPQNSPQHIRLLLYLAKLEQATHQNSHPIVETTTKEGRDPENQLRLLLADDDELIRIVFSEILNNAGYEVIVAKDGDKALQCAQEIEMDVVILDQHMPVLRGDEVAQMLRQRRWIAESVPVFLMTAEPEPARISGETGVITIISKTIPPEDLLALLAEQIKKNVE